MRRSDSPRLVRHHQQFTIDVCRFAFNVLLRGNSIQHEVFLERFSSVLDGVLPDFVFTSHDVFFGKSGLRHFQHLATQSVLSLLFDKRFREIPVGGFFDLLQNLLAGRLALPVFDLAFQSRRESLVEIFFVFGVGSIEKFAINIRQDLFVNFLHFKFGLHEFTSHLHDRTLQGNRQFGGSRVAGRRAFHQLIKALVDAVLKTELRMKLQRHLFFVADHFIVVSYAQVDRPRNRPFWPARSTLLRSACDARTCVRKALNSSSEISPDGRSMVNDS